MSHAGDRAGIVIEGGTIVIEDGTVPNQAGGLVSVVVPASRFSRTRTAC